MSRLEAAKDGWLKTLREFRNDVVHGGFADLDVKEDPLQAYEHLRRILRHLD